MARFLFATMPATGHVNPGLPIARELVARGHDVRWYCGTAFRRSIERTGARFLAPMHGPDYSDDIGDALFPERKKYKGIAQLKFDLRHIFIDMIPGVVRDLEGELQREPADVLVTDSAFAAAPILRERGGPPRAAFGITVLTTSSIDTAPFGLGLLPSSTPFGRLRNKALAWLVNKLIFRRENEYWQAMRATMGLPRTGGSLFDGGSHNIDLVLQSGLAELEYPRSDLPKSVHFVGAFVPPAPEDWTPPSWWGDLESARRVVLVTQGTIANDFDDLLRPAVRALAKEERTLVVVTTGSRPAADLAMTLPANARVEQFIPYARLMPKVDVLVTNGGYGSIQIALAHGVPVVAAGASEDKPEIANRVQWSGVGVGMKVTRPSEQRIRTEVRRVLATPSYKERAMEMRDKLSRLDAPRLSADLIEGIVRAERATVAA